jgi:hypothetical protein
MSALGIVPWLLAGALLGAVITGARPSDDPEPCAQECATTCCDPEVEGLGLSDGQIDAVKSACAVSGRRLRAIAAEEQEVRRRVDLALDAETVDEHAVRQLGKQLADLRGQRLAASLDCVLGVRRVLRPDQLRELCARCGCLSKE